MPRPSSLELEELELEADELLLLSTEDNLQQLAPKLWMTKEVYEGRSTARLVQVIRKYLAEKNDSTLFEIVKTELRRQSFKEEEEEIFDLV